MNPDLEGDERLYSEIPSVQQFNDVVEKCLDEYNQTHKTRMNLVIFRCAFSSNLLLFLHFIHVFWYSIILLVFHYLLASKQNSLSPSNSDISIIGGGWWGEFPGHSSDEISLQWFHVFTYFAIPSPVVVFSHLLLHFPKYKMLLKSNRKRQSPPVILKMVSAPENLRAKHKPWFWYLHVNVVRYQEIEKALDSCWYVGNSWIRLATYTRRPLYTLKQLWPKDVCGAWTVKYP